MLIEISQWKKQTGIFNIRLSFLNATISFHFSIKGLLKFLFIFPCHIMFLIIIVLHLLLCGISNLTLLTKSGFYLQIPYLILVSTHWLFIPLVDL